MSTGTDLEYDDTKFLCKKATCLRLDVLSLDLFFHFRLEACGAKVLDPAPCIAKRRMYQIMSISCQDFFLHLRCYEEDPGIAYMVSSDQQDLPRGEA